MCRDADGRARKHKVKNVYQQGVRSVYKVTLENGKSIKVTENHRLQARDCYKRVDELIVGEDELWCCDFTYDNKPVRKYNFSDVTEKHRGARGIGKHMSGDRCGENNAMYTNGGWTKFKQYKATHAHCEIDGCDKCAENGDRIEIHHIDGDRTNNEDSNLQALCVSHHKQVHFDNGRRKHGEKGYETYLSKVVSIEYAGEEMTYDVEMDSEEHNFFANGMSLNCIGTIILILAIIFLLLARKPANNFRLVTTCPEFYVCVVCFAVAAVLIGFGLFFTIQGILKKVQYQALLKDIQNDTFHQ